MNEQEFHFDQQGIIFAYRGTEFAGLLVTNADESFTKTELMEYFAESSADYLIAADLSEWFYAGEEVDVQGRIEMLVDLAMGGDLSHFSILYHIPKNLH